MNEIETMEEKEKFLEIVKQCLDQDGHFVLAVTENSFHEYTGGFSEYTVAGFLDYLHMVKMNNVIKNFNINTDMKDLRKKEVIQ